MSPEPTIAAAEAHATEEDEYDDGEEGEDYDYDGDDFEVEAEDMARRLQEQLRADIAKAQQEVAAAAQTQVPAVLPPHIRAPPPGPIRNSAVSREERKNAAITTMKAIVSFASRNPLIHMTLSASRVPSAENANIMDIFQGCISSGKISRKAAKPLSEVILALSKSGILFHPRQSSSVHTEDAKRKRDHLEDGNNRSVDSRAYKRVALDQPDLISQINEAVRIVSRTLSTAPSPDRIEPSVVASIQPQLHQIFLFAVTSSPCASLDKVGALQELAGLVQMLGVLSGIHIGAGPSTHSTPWNPLGQMADIGTAVYPCLVPGCHKTFHRLYSLRAHQRTHTLVDRPYRCVHCPASFVRNHDLKRHTRLHDRKAWRCSGCGKVFSRRDAIKRHQDNRGRGGGKTRGEAEPADSACAFAEIVEVEVERSQADDDTARRTKMWTGFAAGPVPAPPALPPDVGYVAHTHEFAPGGHEEWTLEEGQVVAGVLEHAQVTVLQLLGLLHACVSRGLGQSPPPDHVAPGLATLASVIANAQSVSRESTAPATSEQPVEPAPTVDQTNPMPSSSVDMASRPGVASLSLSWLSDDQTKLLEQAIAQAAAAAQAQAEAEAALEEDGEAYDEDEEGEGSQERD